MVNSEYQVKKFARDQELYDLGAIYSSPLNPHVCALDHRRTTGTVLVFARVYDDPKFCYEQIGEFPCGDGEEFKICVPADYILSWRRLVPLAGVNMYRIADDRRSVYPVGIRGDLDPADLAATVIRVSVVGHYDERSKKSTTAYIKCCDPDRFLSFNVDPKDGKLFLPDDATQLRRQSFSSTYNPFKGSIVVQRYQDFGLSGFTITDLRTGKAVNIGCGCPNVEHHDRARALAAAAAKAGAKNARASDGSTNMVSLMNYSFHRQYLALKFLTERPESLVCLKIFDCETFRIVAEFGDSESIRYHCLPISDYSVSDNDNDNAFYAILTLSDLRLTILHLSGTQALVRFSQPLSLAGLKLRMYAHSMPFIHHLPELNLLLIAVNDCVLVLCSTATLNMYHPRFLREWTDLTVTHGCLYGRKRGIFGGKVMKKKNLQLLDFTYDMKYGELCD